VRWAGRAAPTVVTPNQDEAEELVGHEFADDEDLPGAVGEVVDIGAREAILTLPTGCIALVGDEQDRRLYRASVDPGIVDPRSRVGSGDAFLAGYVASRYTGRPPEECVRFAVACGAESVQHFGAGVLDPAAVERLTQQVGVEELSARALHAGG
jgi:1-phosphofructokinase/tagatose 6-phosphate kinase